MGTMTCVLLQNKAGIILDANYVWMLFVDYSSTLSTFIPCRIVAKWLNQPAAMQVTGIPFKPTAQC